ncbi:MAG: very short patch repair endonuclease [Anaerolineaceae bacterium]|nr:very short patch repair endonuclease [Anaerolineaceae bacterium]
MSDNLKPEDRRKTMKAVKGQGTKLEKRLWAMVAGMRLKGWQKNASAIAGKPDVVFPAEHVVIFIDGCFWHGCPYCNRKLPETNKEYWKRKIDRNIELARLHNEKLIQSGWTVVRIWEHEMCDKAVIRARLHQALDYKEQ